MCGIAGILCLGPRTRVTPPMLERMCSRIEHRGPDGSATWTDEDQRVGFGFQRLAIIDLSDDAMQPMSNETGSLVLVFNGEIYNHAELRPLLEDLGHRFRTDHSDTEVLVHGFEEWGIDVVRRLRGMFAFAAWDASARTLWLARDRMGVKPLYWSLHDERFGFASEIKALLADPQQPREIDEESLFHYLSFLTVPAPRTLFAGINKLAAATWLRVTAAGDVHEERYWDPWDETDPLEAPDEDVAARVLEELRTAVHLRKVSDRPAGVFLSGGIDSSTNAALFSEGETRPVQTFSIGYDADYGSYANELDWARRVAETVGADHHELRLSQADLVEFLPEMVRLQDEPIGDPVCVPLYYVSRLARENGVVVAQVGEGADELFWGYPSWRTLLRLQRADSLPVPRVLKRAGVAAASAFGSAGASRPVEFLRRGAAGEPIFWGGAEAFTEAAKQRLLSGRLRRELSGLSSWSVLEPIRDRFLARAWDPSPLHWMTYLDLNLRLPELLLMRVDKMSMGVGLEARVPFLDHRLVELALSIPAEQKTRNGELKRILKLAVRDLLPPEVIARPKQGFGVPVHEWMTSGLGDETQRSLLAFTDATDLLDRGAVQELLDARRGAGLWYLLNLALWWKEYIE